MSTLRQIVLVRHGETDGESSVRYHGSTDVALAPAGREQMNATARRLDREPLDVVVASPLRRSWASAWLVGRGAPVSLVPEFREVDFGRWEGLTREEIEARDPVLFQDWQNPGEDFEYPGGESRAAFRARVARGVEQLAACDVRSALVVVHKGVIRAIAEQLTGTALEAEEPPLGGIVELTRKVDGSWSVGRTSSNPASLAESA